MHCFYSVYDNCVKHCLHTIDLFFFPGAKACRCCRRSGLGGLYVNDRRGPVGPGGAFSALPFSCSHMCLAGQHVMPTCRPMD